MVGGGVWGLGEPGGEVFDGAGAGEEVALDAVAAVGDEEVEGGLVFDAFGDDGESEVVREVDDGADDDLGVGVGGEVDDE